MSQSIDLETPAGRKRARYDLMWGDHGFLRLKFRNLHRISDEMWRANQPSPEHITGYHYDLGIRTIINLRGETPKGYYLLEREACEKFGIELIDFRMYSRDTPSAETFFAARDLFERIRYPALMHCKSGADRAGIMAVTYMHFRKGKPIEEAIEQLSRKYLHIRQGKTGVLDYIFETYLTRIAPSGRTFSDWLQQDYDGPALKREFLDLRSGRINLDELLQRE